MNFTILNIGLDAGLLAPEINEVKTRQIFYSQHLKARILHIVKTRNKSSVPFDISQNVKIYPCSVIHWTFFPAKALLIAFKILRSNKVDLIQVQEPYFAGLLGLMLSKITKIPLVVGLYSDEIGNPAWIKERKLNCLANLIGKFVLRQASGIRSDSRAVAESVEKIINKKVFFIPFLISNAKEFQSTDLKQKLAFKETILGNQSGPLLFAANRLESEKNVPMLLKAVSRVKKDFPELILIIAGSGRMHNNLMAEGRQLLGESVRWLGWVKSDEIGHYYQAADLFLITSNRESAARVLYESFLSGTPVVSTNTAGANEIIDNGLNGIITEVGNVEAFSEAVLNILRDKRLLESMSNQAQIKGAITVSNEAVIEKMKTFYRYALQNNS